MFRGPILSASRQCPSISKRLLICGLTISPFGKKATNHSKANQKRKAHSRSLKKLWKTKSSIWMPSDTRCPFLTSSAYPGRGLSSLTTIRAQFSFQTNYREQIWARRHTNIGIKDFCSRTSTTPAQSNNTILTLKKPEIFRKKDSKSCNHKYRIKQAIRALSLASKLRFINNVSKTFQLTLWSRIKARGASISDWRTRREATRRMIKETTLSYRFQDNIRTTKSRFWFVISIWRIGTCESQRCSTRATWVKTSTLSVHQACQIRASWTALECVTITFKGPMKQTAMYRLKEKKASIGAKSIYINQMPNWEVIGWTPYFLRTFWKHRRTRVG